MEEREEGEKKKVSLSCVVNSKQRKKRIGKKAYLRQKQKLKMAEVEESLVMGTPLPSNTKSMLITQEEEVKEEEDMEREDKSLLVGDHLQVKKVKFDEILEDLGDFGRYQKLAYFLLFLPTIFSAMQKQSW